MKFLKRFLKNESGGTMIEYFLVAALISIAAIAAIVALELSGKFVCEYLQIWCSSQ